MTVTTYVGVVEKGKIRLKAGVKLPENAKVYVVVADLKMDEKKVIRMLTPRLVNRQQMRNAIIACGAQHRQAIVDEQGLLRIKGFSNLQPLPELGVFFWNTQLMRANHGIEIMFETGLAHFQGQALMMRIGHQYHALARSADPL